MALSEKSFDHKEFGKINMVKSPRAVRISISMKPFEPLRLTLPYLASYRRAEEFLFKKEKWIRKNLEKIRKLEDSYTLFTDETRYSTRDHVLEISRSPEKVPRIGLKNKKILVQLPEQADIRDPAIQEMIRWGIQAAWRKEAKKHLPARLAELSRKHDLPYNRAFIKNNKTRWGSCSHRNNINLSLHLMRLPDHLVDYVLLHELVHTVHRNHSKSFWKDLEKLFPNARTADRELKEYRIDIY